MYKHTPESVPFIRSNVNQIVDIQNSSKCTHMDYLNISIELSMCVFFLTCLHRSNTLGTMEFFVIRQIGSYWFILKSNLLLLLSSFDSIFLRILAPLAIHPKCQWRHFFIIKLLLIWLHLFRQEFNLNILHGKKRASRIIAKKYLKYFFNCRNFQKKKYAQSR